MTVMEFSASLDSGAPDFESTTTYRDSRTTDGDEEATSQSPVSSQDVFRRAIIDRSGAMQNTSLLGKMCTEGMIGACQLIETTPGQLYSAQMIRRNITSHNEEREELQRKKAVWLLSRQLLSGNESLNIYKGIRENRAKNTIYFSLFSGVSSAKGEIAATPYWWLFTNGVAASMVCIGKVPFDAMKARLSKLSNATEERTYPKVIQSVKWLFSSSAKAGAAAISAAGAPVYAQSKTNAKALKHRTYTGFVDVLTDTIRHDRPTLIKGGLTRILRVVPLLGIANAVYYFGDPYWLKKFITL